MADKNKGNLRKRLVRPSRQVRDEKDEDAKLASELAGIVGKAVEKATDLGLSVVENVGLKVMESLSPRKPAARVGLMGAAASLFNSTRAKGPEVSRRVASELTEKGVRGGFWLLRAMLQAARKTRRPN